MKTIKGATKNSIVHLTDMIIDLRKLHVKPGAKQSETIKSALNSSQKYWNYVIRRTSVAFIGWLKDNTRCLSCIMYVPLSSTQVSSKVIMSEICALWPSRKSWKRSNWSRNSTRRQRLSNFWPRGLPSGLVRLIKWSTSVGRLWVQNNLN